jgi:hypothetical protein
VLRSMGSGEGVGLQKKLESPTGCAFRGILGMAEVISQTLCPSRLGMDPAFIFGMMFGAKKLPSSLHSQSFIR